MSRLVVKGTQVTRPVVRYIAGQAQVEIRGRFGLIVELVGGSAGLSKAKLFARQTGCGLFRVQSIDGFDDTDRVNERRFVCLFDRVEQWERFRSLAESWKVKCAPVQDGRGLVVKAAHRGWEPLLLDYYAIIGGVRVADQGTGAGGGEGWKPKPAPVPRTEAQMSSHLAQTGRKHVPGRKDPIGDDSSLRVEETVTRLLAAIGGQAADEMRADVLAAVRAHLTRTGRLPERWADLS